MSFLLQPWHILLACLCGLVNQRQQQIIEFQNVQMGRPLLDDLKTWLDDEVFLPKSHGNAVQNLELATSFRDISRVGCAIEELLPSLEVLFGEEIDYHSDSYFYRKVLMLYGPLAELIRDLRDIYENY